MDTDVFERVLLPVAGVDDAHSSTRAARKLLPDDAHVDVLPWWRMKEPKAA